MFAANPADSNFIDPLIGLICSGFVAVFVMLFCILVLHSLSRISNRLEDIDSSTRFLRRLRYNRDSGQFELRE